MKNLPNWGGYFYILSIGLLFNACKKNNEVTSDQEVVPSETSSVMLLDEDFVSSKTITIYDETGKNSVDLLISSTNKELIDYYLKVYNIGIKMQDKQEGLSLTRDTISGKQISDKQEKEFPNDCIAFEITTENLQSVDAEYSLEITKRNLKSYPYPPTTYYSFYKFKKRKRHKYYNGKVLYYPDDTYNDELYYKWAYTNSWIAGWHSDGGWRYTWGFDAADSPMVLYHPLNNMKKYRLEIAMYYDNPKYFTPVSYAY